MSIRPVIWEIFRLDTKVYYFQIILYANPRFSILALVTLE